MGSPVIGECPCGLKAAIPIGGGMRSFKTTCYFPCLCEACHKVVPVNLLAKNQECPACKSPTLIAYDDPRLSDSPGQRVVAGWNIEAKLGRKLILTDGNYRCPKCNNLSLHFRDSGLRWD